MKNSELLQAYAANYSKLMNDEISLKESVKERKELDKILKQKRELLKEIKKKTKPNPTEEEKAELQKLIDEF